MGRWKRWTVGIFSHLDDAVSKIENHDGLVKVAIRDAQEARSRAKVQLQRVRGDGRRLEEQLVKLTRAEQQWRERATRVGAEDEARAIDCLARSRRAAEQRSEVEQQLREHKRVEDKLRSDAGKIEARVADLNRQRNLLRTRQSRVEALRAVEAGEAGGISDVDDILERWEVNVTTSEAIADVDCCDVDDLDADFTREEQKDDLRAELAALLAEKEAPSA